MASASPSACNIFARLKPSASFIFALFTPSATVSAAVAESIAAIF